MTRQPQRVLPDTTVLDAWQEQVSAATKTPWLARELVQRGDALLPQFAAWYHRLRRLPRHTRRALQRRAALSLGGIALLFALGQGPAQAAVLEVNEVTCTLANAITAANTDTATGGCPTGSGADILRLEPPGRTVTLMRALPAIQSEITIDGQQGTIERANQAPDFNILEVVEVEGDCPPFTLQNTTITGGNPNGVFVSSYGGCDSITIEHCTISGNDTSIGSLNPLDTGFYVDITIKRSTISGNTDGIFIRGELSVEDSTFSRNGSIIFVDGNLDVKNTIVSGNSGGIFNQYGVASVNNSMISGNGVGVIGREGGVTINNSIT
jgi:hypothetical protein